MKEKIFTSLKQEYSHLGLGDAVLTAYAESLDAAGIVTDENLDAVIKAQKASLEAIQKSNDKRASDAKKSADEAYAKQKAELEAKLAEANNKPQPEQKPNTEQKPQPEGVPAWFTEYEAKRKAELEEMAASNKKLSEQLQAMEEANNKYKAEQAKAERTAFITSEAKRLGVPEWRSKEGFSIAEDANNEAITEYLQQVANNVKANMLPDSQGFPKFDGKKIEKAELYSLADTLLK